ncbi:hypothetical protein MJT46_013849, partial [Ovis ammon polii x Ovis aries]
VLFFGDIITPKLLCVTYGQNGSILDLGIVIFTGFGYWENPSGAPDTSSKKDEQSKRKPDVISSSMSELFSSASIDRRGKCTLEPWCQEHGILSLSWSGMAKTQIEPLMPSHSLGLDLRTLLHGTTKLFVTSLWWNKSLKFKYIRNIKWHKYDDGRDLGNVNVV